MLRRCYSFQQTRPAFQRSRSLSISRSSSFVVNAPYTISHSDSTVFNRTPRSYLPFSSYKPFVAPVYGVVHRAPRYSDRYPHVRYSGYGGETPGLDIINYSSTLKTSHYTQSFKR
ncbi:hypothetical protein T11_14677 [Trichinella zimbabwensis]|nr:hypothetical protein T11_14677 [Trichinella zimbabwensis]